MLNSRLILRPSLLLLALGASSPLWACECLAPPDYERFVTDEFGRASFVFLGTSRITRRIEVDGSKLNSLDELSEQEQLETWNSAEVEFDIEHVWKGDAVEGITVRTAPTDGACGTGLDTGEQYVVFAYPIPDSESVYMDLCTPTRRRNTFSPERYQWLSEYLQSLEQ